MGGGRGRGAGQADRDRQHHPEADVLDRGDRQDEAGETGVDDPEVEEDLRDDRDRGHGHRDADDEHHRDVVPVGAEVAGEVEDEGGDQAGQERKRGGAEEQDPGDPPVLPAELASDLEPGHEHQQDQPEPRHGGEHSTGGVRAVEEPALRPGPGGSQDGRAEQQPTDDLPHHPGQARPAERGAAAPGGEHQQADADDDRPETMRNRHTTLNPFGALTTPWSDPRLCPA